MSERLPLSSRLRCPNCERLDEAIRDALDHLTGWHSHPSVEAAIAILNKALAPDDGAEGKGDR